jgi:hypothetical protein
VIAGEPTGQRIGISEIRLHYGAEAPRDAWRSVGEERLSFDGAEIQGIHGSLDRRERFAHAACLHLFGMSLNGQLLFSCCKLDSRNKLIKSYIYEILSPAFRVVSPRKWWKVGAAIDSGRGS